MTFFNTINLHWRTEQLPEVKGWINNDPLYIIGIIEHMDSLLVCVSDMICMNKEFDFVKQHNSQYMLCNMITCST